MSFGTNKLVGIDKDLVKDSLIGAGFAALFIFLSVIAPGLVAIGLPSLPQSVAAVGLFLVIVICAPIFESVVFQDIVLDLFDSKMKMPFIVAAILSSIAFSLFHLSAYGGSLEAAGGSFISAFVVGIIFCGLRYYTSSILPVIISHGLINAFILYSPNILIK